MREYGFNEILTLLDGLMSRSQLTHLADRDVVPPDVSASKGRGHGRRYSFRNVVEFAVGLVLIGSNASWLTVELILKELRGAGIWDRLRRPSSRSGASVLLLVSLFEPETRAGVETSGDLAAVPSWFVRSREKAGEKVAEGKYPAMLLVDLELILATLEKKADDKL